MPFLACWAIAALASLLFQRFSMRDSYIETPSPVCGGGVVVLRRRRGKATTVCSRSLAIARDDGHGPSLLRLDAGIPGDLHPGRDLLDLVGPESRRIARFDGEAELIDSIDD